MSSMGKYQLDTKGQAAVTKYHEKQKLTRTNQQEKMEKMRELYLKKKQAKKS